MVRSMTVAGNGYEMTAIAACVLGGISLSGGLGNVDGAAIGAVIMSSIGRLLVFIGLPSTLQQHHYRHDADCDCRH